MTRKHAMIAVFVLAALVALYITGFFVIYMALGRTVPFTGSAYYYATQGDGGYRLRKIASYREGVFTRMEWRKMDEICSVIYRPLGYWELQRHLEEGAEDERKRISDGLIRYGKPVPAGFLWEYNGTLFLTVVRGWYSWDEAVVIPPVASP